MCELTEKERDVETGLDYFGARYYDPVLGICKSVDPLWEKTCTEFIEVYPGWSPYNYVLNIPLILIDPDGKFVVDVHAKIISSVTGKNYYGVYFRQLLHDVTTNLIHIPEYHFDNLNSFKSIKDNFNLIDNLVSSNLGYLEKGLHAIQDFYSHSNYIELFIDWHVSQNSSLPSIHEIPTYDEVNNNSKYEDFKKTIGEKLETGNYPGSHDFMNKDSANSPQGNKKPYNGKHSYFDYAYETALKHSKDKYSEWTKK